VGRIRKQLEIHPKNRVLKNQLRTYEIYLTRHQPESLLSPLRRLPPELLYQFFEFLAPPSLYLNEPDKPSHWSGLPWSSSMASNYIIHALTLDQNPFANFGYEVYNKSILPRILYRLSPSIGWPTAWCFCIFAWRQSREGGEMASCDQNVFHSYRWQHLSVVSHSSHLLRALCPRRLRGSTHRNIPGEDSLTMEAACLLQRKARRNGRYHTPSFGPFIGDFRAAKLLLRRSPDFTGIPIVLRNLVKLRLCGIISSELTIFLLERLIVPAVEEIAIFGDIEGPIPIIPLVTSMISRSTNACILQRLSVRESNYHPGEFTALL
jgi:hypothetical protein